MMSYDLLDVFEAHSGIVSLVGAGGKKTTLYRLAGVHKGRVGVTATVLTPPFRKRLNADVVIANASDLLEKVGASAKNNPRVAYAHPSDKPARLGGVAPSLVAAIHNNAGFDLTLIKADGARLRWLKAPSDLEPACPQQTTTLIPVLSIRAVGQPLTAEIVHRADLVSAIAQAEIGTVLTATHLSRLLAAEEGALKNAGSATVIVLINMVESKQQRRSARLVADQALAASDKIKHVVIASMVQDNPVVDVIYRT